MNWLIVAVAAQFINGSSAVIDKLLLKKSYPNPIGYTFWLGVLGLFSIILIPFGFHILPAAQLVIALVTGAFFICAMLFYFLALYRGEASNAVVLIGALSPIFTLIFSSQLLGIKLNAYQFIGFLILILGGFILFSIEQKGARLKILAFAIASAFFYGLSNTLTKKVFLDANFATGFVWIKIGGILLVLSFLLVPALRRKILPAGRHGLNSETKDEFQNKWAYFLNRGYAGLGSVLIYYAILLGIPPLVDATYNLKYLFIFFGGWFILRERFKGWVLVGKITAVLIIALGVIWLAAGDYLHTTAPDPERPIAWGITFSQKFSRELGLNWKENYEAILNDLNAKHLRLIAYWDLIEPEDGKFDFADLDYQIRRAEENGAEIILVIGQKVPRWPECHYPEWIKQQVTRNKIYWNILKP
ncbi:MAG: EamA family transporter [Parcubacteria group bacterium]|nr:EamA family transporter [Parcubacteria group bacterium]